MRYYISDLHFFHENMNTRMDKRGFESVEVMNEYMISQWNKKYLVFAKCTWKLQKRTLEAKSGHSKCKKRTFEPD